MLAQADPDAAGVEVRFEGADHGAYHLKPVLPETNRDDLTFVRALPLAEAADPAAGILIAYEMNGEPLRQPTTAHRSARSCRTGTPSPRSSGSSTSTS